MTAGPRRARCDRHGSKLERLAALQAAAAFFFLGAASPLAEILPVTLPTTKGTFQRDPATAQLTDAGADSMITRLAEDPAQNAERWKKLPYMMNYQDPGKPKPGAATLLNMTVNNRQMPLLITENYGHGRTAVLATGGTWRWQMSMPVEDQSHKAF